MRPDPRLARLTAALVAAGLTLAPLASPAHAQPPLPPQQASPPAQSPIPPPAAAPSGNAAPPTAAITGAAAGVVPDQQAEVTPPIRVGRVARLQGGVSFHAAAAQAWTPATLNYPVTSGNGFWTQPGAQAELDISDSHLALAAETELDLDTVDTTAVIATLAQGEAYLSLANLAPGESWTVQTPRGTVLLGGNGSYGIAAGDTEHPTLVTVLAGAATVTVSETGVGLQAGPGQAIRIDGTDSYVGKLQPAAPDSFLQAMAASDAQARTAAAGVALPPIVARMPGCTQLAAYGTWKSGTEYGTVWYPRVAAGWAPYRDGSWAYVAPWGWTWIDAAPWGFTPFHYGRWAQIDGAWGWVPGQYIAGVQLLPQPAYAPALVTFLTPEGEALASGAIAGFAAGALVGGAIGWLPLGPREPYYPWFHTRPDWVRDVNIGHVTDLSVVVDNYRHDHFGPGPGGWLNRGAGTLVPRAAFLDSRPIAGIGHPLPADLLGRFQPGFGHAPPRPGPATLGLTAVVAARLGVPAGPPRLAAPGPALTPPGFGPHSGPGGPHGPVPLPVVGRAPGVGPAEHGGPPVSGFAAPHGPVVTHDRPPPRGPEHPYAGPPGGPEHGGFNHGGVPGVHGPDVARPAEPPQRREPPHAQVFRPPGIAPHGPGGFGLRDVPGPRFAAPSPHFTPPGPRFAAPAPRFSPPAPHFAAAMPHGGPPAFRGGPPGGGGHGQHHHG